MRGEQGEHHALDDPRRLRELDHVAELVARSPRAGAGGVCPCRSSGRRLPGRRGWRSSARSGGPDRSRRPPAPRRRPRSTSRGRMPGGTVTSSPGPRMRSAPLMRTQRRPETHAEALGDRGVDVLAHHSAARAARRGSRRCGRRCESSVPTSTIARSPVTLFWITSPRRDLGMAWTSAMREYSRPGKRRTIASPRRLAGADSRTVRPKRGWGTSVRMPRLAYQ